MHNKNMKCFAAAAIAVVSVSAFAGAGGAYSRPVTQFDLMDGGDGPVNIVTPGNDMLAQNRHTQHVALTVLDATGAVVSDAACTLGNDKGLWSGRPGETLTIRRSGADLHITSVKDGQTIASATVPAAPAQIITVATGPFGRDTEATVPQYPGTLVLAPTSAAVASPTPR
jgi:hypothetical protein